MENLGYKEGSSKPKCLIASQTQPITLAKRRLSRARASVVETESLPLSIPQR